jgi:hypothetical protein
MPPENSRAERAVNEKLEALRAYLSEHIADAVIEVHEQPDGPRFVLRRGELDWSVLFTHAFLESVTPADLARRLDELALIEELTRVEDLPLVVEPAGIRLLSNN